MKVFFLVVYLLTLSFHSSSQSLNSDMQYSLSGRRYLKELSTSTAIPGGGGVQKASEVDGKLPKSGPAIEDNTLKEDLEKDEEEHVYYVDYHGVTTHTSPQLPKHPMP